MPHSAPLTELKVLRTYLREHLGAHTVARGHLADKATVLKMLNDAMATELICALRCQRHYSMACNLHSQTIAHRFLDHANEALDHSDQLAARIVQLGGAPDFTPDGLTDRNYAGDAEGRNLSGMIRENMQAKLLAIDGYHSLIQYMGDGDTTTRCLLEAILSDEERHGDELAEQLVALHTRRHVAWPLYSAVAAHSLSATA